MRLPECARRRLLAWARDSHVQARASDFLILNADGPYLARWYVVRQGQRWLRLSAEERQRRRTTDNPREDANPRNIFLHQFLASDDDRALHDHPWPWTTVILDGQYVEHLPADPADPAGPTTIHPRRPGDIICRADAARPHRIELAGHHPVTTLFITGRKCREWGFWCSHGWRHWREFTAPNDSGRVSRGCD